MDLRKQAAIFLLIMSACASHREPASKDEASLSPPGLLTPAGMGSQDNASAHIKFKISSRSSAELDVVDQKKRLFFVFEGWDLQGGFYEVWALKQCHRPGAGSVLKASASEGRLMGFKTLHGFVVTEGSSDVFDLAPDSQRSLMKKRIALFRQQKTQVNKLACGALLATNSKVSTALLMRPEL